MNIDKKFLAILLTALFITSVGAVLKDLADGKIEGVISIIAGFILSLLGGGMLFTLVSIYTDTEQWHILATCVGAYGGSKTIDLISKKINSHFNLNTKEDEIQPKKEN